MIMATSVQDPNPILSAPAVPTTQNDNCNITLLLHELKNVSLNKNNHEKPDVDYSTDKGSDDGINIKHQKIAVEVPTSDSPNILVASGCKFKDFESYMNWNLDPNPNYSRYIQVAQSKFSSSTVHAFARGKTTPLRSSSRQDVYQHPNRRQNQHTGRLQNETRTGPYLNSTFPSPLTMDASDFDENKRYNMFEHITNLGALAYFYLEMDNLAIARIYFMKALECITQSTEENVVPRDYFQSFAYVLSLLGFYAAEEKENKLRTKNENQVPVDSENGENVVAISNESYFGSFRWFYDGIPSFDSLTPKGKAGVYGMKSYFGKMVKADEDKMLEVIRKAIALDPVYYEWHYCLQAILRSKRRKHSYHHFQPNPVPLDEERDAICLANQLYPYHPRCMLAEILFLADILKAHYSHGQKSLAYEPPSKWTPFCYRNLRFETVTSIVDFICQQVKKILALSPTSVHVNTTVAEIFTVLLPHRFRDFNFAKECLERAHRFHPWSSKANHRMGAFYLNHGLHGDSLAKICSYFERAVDMDETNYPSLCAFIQVLMQQLPSNCNKLLELIDQKLTLETWDPIQTAGLHYFKGLLYFNGSKWKESIDAFKEAYDIHQDSLTFEDLPYQHRRYFWPPSSVLIPSVMMEQFKKIKRRTKNPERKGFISILIGKLISCIESERKYQNELMTRKKVKQEFR